MSALDQALRSAAAELAANRRLRWGTWLILGILLLYCILVQSDRLAAVHDEYAAASARLDKAESLLQRQDWHELLDAERKAHQSLEATFWDAGTEGLAQAKLQAALARIVGPLELRNPRIRSGVSQPAPNLPGIWRVQTRLDAGYRPGVELQVLYALATYPNKLIVDRLDLRRGDRQDSYMTLILSAYFVGVEAERTE